MFQEGLRCFRRAPNPDGNVNTPNQDDGAQVPERRYQAVELRILRKKMTYARQDSGRTTLQRPSCPLKIEKLSPVCNGAQGKGRSAVTIEASPCSNLIDVKQVSSFVGDVFGVSVRCGALSRADRAGEARAQGATFRRSLCSSGAPAAGWLEKSKGGHAFAGTFAGAWRGPRHPAARYSSSSRSPSSRCF